MEKFNFAKTLASYRADASGFAEIDVPTLQYLAVDGHGDPNAGGPFAEAVSALFGIGYKLKFASKAECGRDYAVMPLEGLWYTADMATFAEAMDKSTWDWTLLMMVPEWITEAMFTAAVAANQGKKDAETLAGVRLQTLSEGRCVQRLHIGPFEAEAETLRQLHQEYLPGQGLVPSGHHHEIYLSDFTRTAPERLRTILRQPVTKATSS